MDQPSIYLLFFLLQNQHFPLAYFVFSVNLQILPIRVVQMVILVYKFLFRSYQTWVSDYYTVVQILILILNLLSFALIILCHASTVLKDEFWQIFMDSWKLTSQI